MKYITRDKFTNNLSTILDEIEGGEGESVYTVLGSDDEPAIHVVTHDLYEELMQTYEGAE
jgi:hypothetical protein